MKTLSNHVLTTIYNRIKHLWACLSFFIIQFYWFNFLDIKKMPEFRFKIIKI